MLIKRTDRAARRGSLVASFDSPNGRLDRRAFLRRSGLSAGGLAAHPWASAIPGVDVVDPLLTLRGLALLQHELAGAQSVPSA